MITGEQQAERSAVTVVETVMSRLMETAKAEAVFGKPVERGETVVIPCSEVMAGVGMGGGSGSSPDQQGRQSEGSGLGTGGGARARPVAAIIITAEGVRVEPIVDATKIALAAFTTFGFIFAWLVRLNRHARRASHGKGPSIASLKKAIDS